MGGKEFVDRCERRQAPRYTSRMHHLGLRHQALRQKRILPTIPRSKRVISVVDTLAYIATFSSLFFTIDQIRIIWVEHDVQGVSTLAWSVYTVSSVVWLAYGAVHREKVIFITNILWMLFSALVVVGIFLYG